MPSMNHFYENLVDHLSEWIVECYISPPAVTGC